MIVKILAFAVCLGMAFSQAPPPTLNTLLRPSPGPAPWSRPWGPNPWITSNPWIPPWVMQWIPQWIPCDPTVTGPSCHDCNSRVICTKIGGLLKSCSDPNLPYCSFGECSAVPSTQCVPAAPGGLQEDELVQVADLPASEGGEQAQLELPILHGDEEEQIADIPATSQAGKQVRVVEQPASQDASETVQMAEVPPLQPEPY